MKLLAIVILLFVVWYFIYMLANGLEPGQEDW